MTETNPRKYYRKLRLENIKLRQELELANRKQEKTDKKLSKKDKIIEGLIAENLDLKNELKKSNAQIKKYDNANTPPSKRYPARNTEQPAGTGPKRSRGGQKGHRGRTNKPKPTEFETHEPVVCPCCGSKDLEITGTKLRNITDREKILKVITKQHTINTCRCKKCGKEGIETKVAGVPKQGDYGPGIIAAVAAAWESRMPIKMISENSSRDIGVHLSTGAVSNILRRVGERLDAQAVAMLLALVRSKILHIDETSYRLNGRTVWVWILLNPKTGVTYYIIRPSRGANVLDSLLSKFKGTIVCDGWRAYSKFTTQRCWAHLIREIKYVVKLNPDDAEAARLLEQLQRIYEDGKKYRPKKDRQRDHDRLAASTQNLIDKYRDNENCQSFLTKLQNALPDLFRFVLDPRIPPTNNAAERGLREIVVHRKIRGQMKSDHALKGMGNIFTCFATWKNCGQDHLAEMVKSL